MPTVSVIIPTYNRAAMLDEALASVYAQTYSDLEVIVVDDGSTDHTGAIVNKYSGRINFIRQENKGRSLARNAGIVASRGRYLAFLDDDDLWLPRKLESQVDALESLPGVDLVYSPMRVLGGVAHGAVWNEVPPASEVFLQELLSSNCIGNPSVVMIRKRSLERLGVFDPLVEPCEDWDLWIRLAVRGHHFHFINEPLVEYRMHENNTTMHRLHAGFLAVLAKVFAAEETPAALKVKRRFFLSRRLAHIGDDCYFLLDLGMARRAWFEAVKLDPSVLSTRMLGLAAKSLWGAGMLSRMRRAKASFLRKLTPATSLSGSRASR